MPLPLIRAAALFSGRASDTSPQASTSPMRLSEKVQAHEPRQRGKRHTLAYTPARSPSTSFHAPRFHGYAGPRHRTMRHLRRRDCDITQPKRVRLTSAAISLTTELSIYSTCKQARCFGIRLCRICCFMPQGSGILRYCNHPLRPPHPSVQSFGMTGTPLKLRTRHGESPITAARTSDFQLSVRKGIAFQSVPLHSGSSGGSTRHSPTLHSIALLYTPRPFGMKQKESSRTSRQHSFCQSGRQRRCIKM